MSELPFESPEHPLRGETVVFTGKLWSLGRKEARAVVERLGGIADDEVTLRTTLLVVGGESYPDGVPDISRLPNDQGTHRWKLRRAAQVNAEQPGRISIVSEDDFCRHAGLPTVAELRDKHYGQRDVLAMYPALREDHLRYLQKWGFIRSTFQNNADKYFEFGDLTLLRQVHADLQQGASFRGILRDLQASRAGQLTFDFRIDAEPARILTLTPRERTAAGRRRPAPPRTDHRPRVRSPRPRSTSSPARCWTMAAPSGKRRRHRPIAARSTTTRISSLPSSISRTSATPATNWPRRRPSTSDPSCSNPSYFEAYFNLGNIHHDHGRYTDAEQCYAEALALNPDYPDAHFYLAVTLEKMGRSSEARQHWRDYQDLAPQGEWVELAREFSD